ncbi:peptidylprolyl isomerase [Melampsora americana]|nr:peptidylprolyl isomerase [Melampsora americana]
MSYGAVFSAVVKPGNGLLYDCEVLTHVTNIALEVKGPQALSKPFLTVLKLQYEGPVIEGVLDVEAEKKALEDELKKQDEKRKEKKKAAKKVDEDEDEDDDDDYSDYEVEAKEVVVASFTPSLLQLSTNIHLHPGEQYRFVLSGSDAEVHLLGSYVHSDDADLSPYDSEGDSDEDMDDFDLDHLEDSDDEIASAGRIEEIEDEPKPTKKAENPVSKKRAIEDGENGDVSMADVSMGGSEIDTSNLSKNQKKKLAKKLKAADGSGVPSKADDTPQKEKNQKKPTNESAKKSSEAGSAKKPEASKKPESTKTVTTASGLKIIDAKVGEGAEAKANQMVSMRYIGKLDNGKVFDSNTKGEPFRFKLGKGEVIKGWDEGIKGMKIGGERKLIIPSGLAYGKRGSPPEIPANATLTFEVKLLSIK